jgi:putative FmdB family regulatory protein
MPFYEYQCKNCGHTLEAMQKVNDSPLKKCPSCGKSQLTRLMSAPVFRLKGGGWYETDFKGEQDHKKNLADRPEVDAAADAKPAADAKADVAAKDATAKDAPAKDVAAKDAVKASDKSSDKPVKAAPVEAAKKPASAGISRRGTGGTAAVKAKARKAPTRVAKKSKSLR